METAALEKGSMIDQLGRRLREQGIEGRLVPKKLIQKVVDSPAKYFLLDSSNRKRGFLLCSSPVAPDLIARSMMRARQAKQMLGDPLGGVVVQPIHAGQVDGLSYALLPYHRPVRENKLIRAIQRIPLRPTVLDWLRQVASATASPAKDDELLDWERCLRRISEENGGYSAPAADALEQLSKGAWRPRFTLAHNDLWMNNLLYASRGARFRFVLIDWAGSNTRARPIYDLVRFAISSVMPNSMLSRQLDAHAKILNCERHQLGWYLLAALGHLGLNLERFPIERYRETAEVCWRTYAGATPGLSGLPKT